jgi:predicted unusual protein kinase regulating ubiquinone biosynthesis (AarF/ABC1/UbiB family)
VPASLTLTGKAFAQMQSAAAELDPTVDPFSVAESFVMKTTLNRLAGDLDPKKIFYVKQKAWVRFMRLLEGVEGLVGARPGGSLPMHIQGTERLEETIAQASKRLSLALGLGGALVATAITANSEQAPRWVPAVMGSVGSALAAGLLMDRPRRRD